MNESEIAAEASSALTTTREDIVYEFSRIAMLDGWWIWALAVGAFSGLIYLCYRLYRRDTVELSPGVKTTLIILRFTTIFAVLFFFLGLQRRAQQRVTRTSEVAVLVDTSQSMSLPTSSAPGSSSSSRSAQIASIMADSELLSSLEKSHRVTVYAFDDDAEPRELESRSPHQH
jgi:hypothetical protein